MDVNFALFENRDAADVKKMVYMLYHEDAEGEPIDEDKIDKTINEIHRNLNKIHLYLFKHLGENIGYGIVVFFWSNELGGDVAVIDELYVLEKERNMGVGTKFLSFIERMENIVAMQLEVTPSNKRALSYYTKMGFSPCPNAHLIKRL